MAGRDSASIVPLQLERKQGLLPADSWRRGMTTAATLETSESQRPEIINCVAHLRAFAVMLAGNCQRADDLVRDTILQTFTPADRPIAMIKLKVQMFAGLRKLHYAALRQSTSIGPGRTQAGRH